MPPSIFIASASNDSMTYSFHSALGFFRDGAEAQSSPVLD
jgi:hypothetical protein